MSLMELFENPETFSGLTMGERLAGAGITALMGMGITFLILIILWGCIVLMNKILYRPKKKESPATSPKETSVSQPVVAEGTAPKAPASVPEDPSDDALIAVISAAIAAYEEGETTSDLVVRKIKRVGGLSTTWAAAGRNECIESRKI